MAVQGQDRTGQERARAGHGRGSAGLIEQVQYRGRTGQFRADQGKGRIGKRMVRLGKAGQGKAVQNLAWQGSVTQG